MTIESSNIKFPEMGSIEAPDVVEADGEVRSQDDIKPVFPAEPTPLEELYADELAKLVEKPTPPGRIVEKVDAWLDVPRGPGEHTIEEACAALHIDPAAYYADYEALLQAREAKRATATMPTQVVPERISGRSIIEAQRQRALDGCETEADKIRLQARFRAEDESRARS